MHCKLIKTFWIIQVTTPCRLRWFWESIWQPGQRNTLQYNELKHCGISDTFLNIIRNTFTGRVLHKEQPRESFDIATGIRQGYVLSLLLFLLAFALITPSHPQKVRRNLVNPISHSSAWWPGFHRWHCSTHQTTINRCRKSCWSRQTLASTRQNEVKGYCQWPNFAKSKFGLIIS